MFIHINSLSDMFCCKIHEEYYGLYTLARPGNLAVRLNKLPATSMI